MGEDEGFQEELLRDLAADPGATGVTWDDDSEVVAQLNTHFRFGGLWEGAPTTFHAFQNRGDDTLAGALRLLTVFQKDAALDELSEVFLIGDGVTELAFRMKWKTLKSAFKYFWRVPEDLYVCNIGMEWCFLAKFIGSIYWGPRPGTANSRRSRQSRERRQSGQA